MRRRREHYSSESEDGSDSDSDSSDESSEGDPNEFQTPEAVKQFLEELQRGLDKRNIKLLTELYEEKFAKITEQYFKQGHWPTLKFAGEFLQPGLPMCLYKELTIRHILTNLQALMKLSDYIDSWNNSVEIMRIISRDLDEPTIPGKVQLPSVWLWDLMDEFVYHYQKFQQFRAKTYSNRKDADSNDVEKLNQNKMAWDSGEVMALLEEIARKSKVDLYLQKVREGKKDDRDLPCESARLIGYYAKVQLLRVHSLHGEYLKGLKAVDKVDLRLSLPLPLYCTSASCHVALFYYLGFAYMMQQRYYDATQTFSHILLFLAKSRMTASYQDLMQQKIFHLFLMCVTLCPSSLDEQMGKIVSEKYAEVHYKFQQTLANRHEGEADFKIFEEKFSYSCPKFITPYFAEKDFSAPPNEMHKMQLEKFLQEVKSMRMLPTLTSFMKLYTTISLEKLRRFCEVDMDTLHAQMDALKKKSMQLVYVPESDQGPAYGEERNCGDIDFCIKDDKVHVFPIKKEISHTQVFLKSIAEMQDIITTLECETGVEAY